MVLNPDLTLGIGRTYLATYYKPETVEYGFFESFPAGINTVSACSADM